METLETTRLTIRPFVGEDLDAAHRLLDHDLKWSGTPLSLQERGDRLRFYIDLAKWDATSHLYGYRAITRREDNTLIGIAAFQPVVWSGQRLSQVGVATPHDLGSIELEVECAIATAERGRGLGTEAVAEMIRFAFDQLRLARVVATGENSNQPWIELLLRVGMRVIPNRMEERPGVLAIIRNGELPEKPAAQFSDAASPFGESHFRINKPKRKERGE